MARALARARRSGVAEPTLAALRTQSESATLPRSPSCDALAQFALRVPADACHLVFVSEFLGPTDDDDGRDDMLFYVPLAGGSLIVHRNAMPPPAPPPDVAWPPTLWLNVAMQLRYHADVTVLLSPSARVVRSYPVFPSPYHVAPLRGGGDAPHCTFPYLHFALENDPESNRHHGVLPADSRLFLQIFAAAEPQEVAVAEVTMSHSACLDQLNRHGRLRARDALPSEPTPQATTIQGWFARHRRRRRQPNVEHVVESGAGVAQIACHCQKQKGSNKAIEYAVDHVRVHILDLIARLLDDKPAIHGSPTMSSRPSLVLDQS